MLPDMGFISVVARQLDMVEAVKWPIEVRPKSRSCSRG